ncbi:MAG TPA: maleylpyruvate isomerase family mycothiol-dependent enzyme [Candidatus Dormibacteraeota bacterium]|nr:maleylpyruvate isomerase family mycothiol-dependent enzyme [Candidatus Dormibacteraeota bacterium]
MSRLTHQRYVELLHQDGERLVRAGHHHLQAAVPWCPGWDVREVVRHTGSVYRHKVACMQLGRSPGEDGWIREPAPHEDLELWFQDSLELLLDELRSRQPEDATFTWWPEDQTVGFWGRRMALETAVHRVDVESAAGSMTPVDPALALDGIDEVLRIFLVARDQPADADGQHRVDVASDGESWTVELHNDRVTTTAGASPDADARLSGDSEPLFLYLWGRAERDGLEVSGDTTAVDALRRRLVAATQ